MAEVEIEVAGKIFRVTCDDGQEAHLQRISTHLGDLTRELSADLGDIGETRLILLAALTVCDELEDARRRLAGLMAERDTLGPQTLGGAARVIEAAADRIETMASKVA